ncbi:prenyltransferase [Thalassoglobus neptunius]|uniref:Prenyltransferase n=1 Tax=Thalassoglobus neptunius TaxID=1938619 RepID=A0A5C5XA80_9PLAN|nr:UbiA family prenyltransferase [Thalassoglobus neptunius]TWT59085.1 prenyltransferase [Thalassoglobus neptunius]
MNVYLRLCRFPTVFTAISNTLAGFLIAHGGLAPLSDFILVLVSTVGIYLAGMVFNDVFDVEQDREERPSRPIPSGAVSAKAATTFGSILMGSGLVCAAIVGLPTFLLAIALCLSVLLYDRYMKRTQLGPIFMGLCRTINLLMAGSAAADSVQGVFQQPLLWYAGAIGVYIVGVTLFAKREAVENSRGPLALSLAVIDLGLFAIAFWIGRFSSFFGIDLPVPGDTDQVSILFVWGVIFLTINRRVLRAISFPSPATIQPAVGVLLLSLIVIDAMVIFGFLGSAALPYSLTILALLVPAVVVRRWIPMT